MSRVGRKPIPIPDGVQVELGAGGHARVKGKLGELARSFNPTITITQEEGALHVRRSSDNRLARAAHGLTRALLANMVEGVSVGFSRRLLISGVGYRLVKKGSGVEFSLGYSHPIMMEPPPGIEFETERPTEILVKGIDKEKVGQVAANIRALRAPEPYKGKGIHYEGERILRKAGKTASKK